MKDVNKLKDLIKNRKWDDIMKMLYPSAGSHGIDHIKTVLKTAKEITNFIKLEIQSGKLKNDFLSYTEDELIVACIFHDCTQEEDRKNHQESGAKFTERVLTGIYSKDSIEKICNAIRKHRASYKGNLNPGLEQVLSSADRGKPNLDIHITRSVEYAKEHGEDIYGAWKHAIEHMKENILEMVMLNYQ